MSVAEQASACISLKYKYSSMVSCVRGQRPDLLADPVLWGILSQIDALEEAFEGRVYALAGEYDDNET